MKQWFLIMCCCAAVSADAQHISMPKETTSKQFSFQPATTTKAPVTVQPNFYSSHMAFFCRQEIKFEKQFHVPLIFRLGSVEYNNWLEQKPNSGYKPCP